MANVLIPKKSTVAGKVPTTLDLNLGEICVNSTDRIWYYRQPDTGNIVELGGGGGGSVTIDTTAADLFSATSGTFSADDPGADRIFFWDDSAGRATHLEIGTGLQISGTTLSADIKSDPTGVTGADAIANIISLTQAEYDAIATPDAATLYIITD